MSKMRLGSCMEDLPSPNLLNKPSKPALFREVHHTHHTYTPNAIGVQDEVVQLWQCLAHSNSCPQSLAEVKVRRLRTEATQLCRLRLLLCSFKTPHLVVLAHSSRQCHNHALLHGSLRTWRCVSETVRCPPATRKEHTANDRGSSELGRICLGICSSAQQLQGSLT